MSHPPIESPINVQISNPYLGLDRGLFKYRSPGMQRMARIHKALWTTHGPAAGAGLLQFQIMYYNSTPVTEEQYAAGELAKSPDGTPWFNMLVRGLVMDPIMVEYWAIRGYYAVYADGQGTLLPQETIDIQHAQANAFTQTMGQFMGITQVVCKATFDALHGKPLSRTDLHVTIDYTKNNQAQHLVLDQTRLPALTFDPVSVAIATLQSPER